MSTDLPRTATSFSGTAPGRPRSRPVPEDGARRKRGALRRSAAVLWALPALGLAVLLGAAPAEAQELDVIGASVLEGASGTETTMRFTATLSAPATQDYSTLFSIIGATPNVDYKSTGGSINGSVGTLSFRAGERTKTYTVTINGDDTPENNEEITFNFLSDNLPSGMTRGRFVKGKILNDDGLTVTVASSSVVEGTGTSTSLVFTAQLDALPTEGHVDFYWRVVGGTASPIDDFSGGSCEAPTDGRANKCRFANNTNTSVRFSIPVSGDDVLEGHETVTVELYDLGRAVFPGGSVRGEVRTLRATGTIFDDDDDAPTLTVDSPSVVEGGAGSSTSLTFTVTSSISATATAMTFDWEARADTATAGEDFTAARGTGTIASGTAMTTVTVDVTGDDVGERDETVTLVLSNPMNAGFAGGADTISGTGTIRNDDPSALSIDDPERGEGDGALTFTVTLEPAATGTVTVNWGVAASGTASSTADFRQTDGGTLTFRPDETHKTFTVDIIDDATPEVNETVIVRLSTSTNATIADAWGTGTIVDDDIPTLTVASSSVVEGNSGTTDLTFTVTLSEAPVQDVTFDWEVRDGTATVSDDVTTATGTVTIMAGTTTATILVSITADDVGEYDETLRLVLSSPTGATFAGGGTTLETEGIIRNDDLAFEIEARAPVDESAGSSTPLFNVKLLPMATIANVEVTWEVVEAASTASGTDYRISTTSRMIEFNVGGVDDLAMIEFDIVDDDETEDDETVTVRLVSTTMGAEILVASATAVILDNDGNAEARTRALTYILAGIGRTIATNVVDLVWERAESHRTGGGSHATLGGRRLDTAFADGGGDALLRTAAGLLGVDADSEALLRDAERRLARGGGLDAFRDWVDLPDSRDLAGRSSFAVSFANGAEGLAPFTFWGRGTLTAFESGIEDDTFGDFTADGDVIAGHLGLDYRFRQDLLAGVALSHTLGDVDYAFADEASGRGAVETEITALHPYVHWVSSQGIGVWGTLGWGTGSAELTEEGEDAIETDLGLQMAAAGVRDELARVMETDLALKADVFMTVISADAVDGGKELQELDAEASRVRVAVEGTRERSLDGGAMLVGRFELGARVDGGDAEEGAGADLAGGFTWTAPDIGLEVRGRGSMLLVHQESDFKEWGLGLGASWDPGPAGRGFSFSVEPTWRAPVSNGAQAMWNAAPGDAGRPASARGASLDARLGYGMGILGDRALVTAFGELGRVDGDGRLRLGAELRRPAGGSPLGLELYGERRDRAAGPDHSLVLKGRIGF